MSTKRPCAICRRWFTIDPRVGKRHRVCDADACQTARNKRSCTNWRKQHPDAVKAARVRRKLPKTPPDPPEVVLLDPMRHFDPRVVRHEMGVEAAVVLEEIAKVLAHLARHEMPPKPRVGRARPPKVVTSAARHETAEARPPP
jgi:hypothetical protein